MENNPLHREIAYLWLDLAVRAGAATYSDDVREGEPSRFQHVYDLVRSGDIERLGEVTNALAPAADETEDSVRQEFAELVEDARNAGIDGVRMLELLEFDEPAEPRPDEVASAYLAHLIQVGDEEGLRSFVRVDLASANAPTFGDARMRLLADVVAISINEPPGMYLLPPASMAAWDRSARRAISQMSSPDGQKPYDAALWLNEGTREMMIQALVDLHIEAVADDPVVQALAERFFAQAANAAVVVADANDHRRRDVAMTLPTLHVVEELVRDGNPLELDGYLDHMSQVMDAPPLGDSTFQPVTFVSRDPVVITGAMKSEFAALSTDLKTEGVDRIMLTTALGNPTRDQIPGMFVASAIKTGNVAALERIVNDTIYDERPDIDTVHQRVAAAIAAQHLGQEDDAAQLLTGRDDDPEARATVAQLVREGTSAEVEDEVAGLLDLWSAAREIGIASAVRDATPGIDDDGASGNTVDPIDPPEPGDPLGAAAALQQARIAARLGLTGDRGATAEEARTQVDTPKAILTADRPVPDQAAADLATEALDTALPELNAI